MSADDFKKQVAEGIPEVLPVPKPYDHNINHAPKRKDILNAAEKKLALKNALRYFPASQHRVLSREFAAELRERGRIYMYRFRPDYEIKARNLNDFPHRSVHAAAIMLMISNNLDISVAQHPDDVIT
jgi:urocanate hydratase